MFNKDTPIKYVYNTATACVHKNGLLNKERVNMWKTMFNK